MWRGLWLGFCFWALWCGLADAQNAITLNWDDRSTDEDGFKVERGASMTGSFTEIAAVGPNLTSYVDADELLVAGTLYCYRVRAFKNSGGNSGYANARCTVPGPKEELRFKVTPP